MEQSVFSLTGDLLYDLGRKSVTRSGTERKSRREIQKVAWANLRNAVLVVNLFTFDIPHFMSYLVICFSLVTQNQFAIILITKC